MSCGISAALNNRNLSEPKLVDLQHSFIINSKERQLSCVDCLYVYVIHEICNILYTAEHSDSYQMMNDASHEERDFLTPSPEEAGDREQRQASQGPLSITAEESGEVRLEPGPGETLSSGGESDRETELTRVRVITTTLFEPHYICFRRTWRQLALTLRILKMSSLKMQKVVRRVRFAHLTA